MKRSTTAIIFALCSVLQNAAFPQDETQTVPVPPKASKAIVPSKWVIARLPSIHIGDNSNCVYELKDELDLSRLDLTRAKITGRTLKKINFANSDLSGADFSHSVFIECDFSNAKMSGIKTDEATEFINCNFKDAIVVRFDFAKLSENDLASLSSKSSYVPFLPQEVVQNLPFPVKKIDPQEDFTNRYVPNVSVGLPKEQFLQSKNYQSKLIRYLTIWGMYDPKSKKITCLDYSDIDLSNTLLVDCQFNYVDFKNAKFEDAKFEDAKLIDVDLSKTINLTAEQIKSTWNWKNERMNWFPKSTLDYFKNELGLDWSENIVNK